MSRKSLRVTCCSELILQVISKAVMTDMTRRVSAIMDPLGKIAGCSPKMYLSKGGTAYNHREHYWCTLCFIQEEESDRQFSVCKNVTRYACLLRFSETVDSRGF